MICTPSHRGDVDDERDRANFFAEFGQDRGARDVSLSWNVDTRNAAKKAPCERGMHRFECTLADDVAVPGNHGCEIASVRRVE